MTAPKGAWATCGHSGNETSANSPAVEFPLVFQREKLWHILSRFLLEFSLLFPTLLLTSISDPRIVNTTYGPVRGEAIAPCARTPYLPFVLAQSPNPSLRKERV